MMGRPGGFLAGMSTFLKPVGRAPCGVALPPLSGFRPFLALLPSLVSTSHSGEGKGARGNGTKPHRGGAGRPPGRGAPGPGRTGRGAPGGAGQCKQMRFCSCPTQAGMSEGAGPCQYLRIGSLVALGTVIVSTGGKVGARQRKEAIDRSSCRWRHCGAAEFAPRSLALEMVRVAGSAAKACLRRVSRHGAVRPRPVGLNHFHGYVTYFDESLAC